MKYPMLSNHLLFRMKQDGDGETMEVLNCRTDEEYEMPISFVWFAKSLTGKRNPYEVEDYYVRDIPFPKEVVDRMLSQLDSAGMLRHSRILEKRGAAMYFTLWDKHCFPSIAKILSRLFITALNILWIPLAMSVFWTCCYWGFPAVDISTLILSCLLSATLGGGLHLLGHVCAVLAQCSMNLFEVGVCVAPLTRGYWVGDMRYASVSEKKAVYMAGLKGSILAASAFLTAYFLIPGQNPFFYYASVFSQIYCVVQMFPFRGSDGFQIAAADNDNMNASLLDCVLDDCEELASGDG